MLTFALASCASETATSRVGSDHPASAQGAEGPPPNWTSALPLAEEMSTPPAARVDGMPAPQDPKAAPGSELGKLLYTCPMHAQIVRDKPGNCPICGMKLVEMKPDMPKPGGHP